MHWFAEHQPVTPIVDAIRGLFVQHQSGRPWRGASGCSSLPTPSPSSRTGASPHERCVMQHGAKSFGGGPVEPDGTEGVGKCPKGEWDPPAVTTMRGRLVHARGPRPLSDVNGQAVIGEPAGVACLVEAPASASRPGARDWTADLRLRTGSDDSRNGRARALGVADYGPIPLPSDAPPRHMPGRREVTAAIRVTLRSIAGDAAPPRSRVTNLAVAADLHMQQRASAGPSRTRLRYPAPVAGLTPEASVATWSLDTTQDSVAFPSFRCMTCTASAPASCRCAALGSG